MEKSIESYRILTILKPMIHIKHRLCRFDLHLTQNVLSIDFFYLQNRVCHYPLSFMLAIRGMTAPIAEDECGDLGVMQVPESVDPSTVRKCFEHPLSNTAVSSRDEENSTNQLFKRACWFGAQSGCINGHRWKRCDPRSAGHLVLDCPSG